MARAQWLRPRSPPPRTVRVNSSANAAAFSLGLVSGGEHPPCLGLLNETEKSPTGKLISFYI